MRNTIIIMGALAALCGLAEADVIQLKNGGKVEGKIVQQDKRTLVVRIKGGGQMQLSMKQVKYVQTRASSDAAYADELAEVNFNDPMEIERLSLWASQKGLGDKAQDLLDMAQGLRLERMVAKAKSQERAQAFVDIYYWARSAGLDDAVLMWILGQGKGLDPGDKSVQGAYERQAKDVEERAARVRRHAEISRRPRYKMVSKILQPATVPTIAEMKARIASERRVRRAKRKDGQINQERSWLARARAMRLAEAKLRAGIRKARREATPAQEEVEPVEVEVVIESAESDD